MNRPHDWQEKGWANDEDDEDCTVRWACRACKREVVVEIDVEFPLTEMDCPGFKLVTA